MEAGQTVQESALHAGRQAWWPLDAMACSLGDTTTSGGGGFLLGWDPQLSYFGLGAWGAGTGDLGTCERELEELVVPKCKPVSLFVFVSVPCSAGVSMALTRSLSGMCARHGVPGVGGVNGGSRRLADAAGCDGDARGRGAGRATPGESGSFTSINEDSRAMQLLWSDYAACLLFSANSCCVARAYGARTRWNSPWASLPAAL